MNKQSIRLTLLATAVAIISAEDDKSCYVQVAPRTFDGTPSNCAPGQDNDLFACYDAPNDGFECVGTSCSQECPSNFGDLLLSCVKPSYNRKVKSWWPFRYKSCNSGYKVIGS